MMQHNLAVHQLLQQHLLQQQQQQLLKSSPVSSVASALSTALPTAEQPVNKEAVNVAPSLSALAQLPKLPGMAAFQPKTEENSTEHKMSELSTLSSLIDERDRKSQKR